MGTPKNKPFVAQQPAPRFANDAGGFWHAVASRNDVGGVLALLPADTAVESDTAIKASLLDAQINWQSVSIRWKGAVIKASIADAQFLLALEEGGDVPEGKITLVLNKFKFGFSFPSYDDTIEIQAAGKWHQFMVRETTGQNDDNDPAITLYLEKDQNELGD